MTMAVEHHTAKERILVCVGPSFSSARLIHAAHRLAEGLGASWLAVTVDAPDTYPMNSEDRHRQLDHMRLAESLGAITIRLTGKRVSLEIIRCARKHEVTRILIGKPTLNRWRDRFRPSLVHELVRISGDIEIQFIAGQDPPPPAIVAQPDKSVTSWQGYVASLLAVVITTVLVMLGRQHLTSSDLVMLYLLPIMAIAFRFGKGPSLLASALSVAAYDFFFVHPYFTFLVEDSQYILTFTILFLVGIVFSGLMTRIRKQERKAQERERQTDALYRLSRDIIATLNDEEMAGIITRHAACIFGGEVALCLAHEHDASLRLVAVTPDAFQPTEQTMEMIRWSFGHGQAAGFGTPNLPNNAFTSQPISISPSRILGILALRIANPGLLCDDHNFFMEAFAHQASLAIDRARLSEEANQAVIRAKSEELRGTLLSMASHDLRTPLAAITGAGTTLRDDDGVLDHTQQHELLETICTEALRMDRLITNLLDMVRLESGGCQLRLEWVPYEELMETALVRMEERIRLREVMIHADERVSMLYVDPIFFLQVLVNLLDNAIKYTPTDAAISLLLENLGEGVVIRVQDSGPGIAPGFEERIFEKFVRGEATGVPGSGLGLAICRGVIHAHGGTILAMTRDSGGAEFRIHLPQPPLPMEIIQEEQS
ncbi:MAG: sensor histidine kinase KdpD [Magnetococcales bacterium]|nr:sensor histidine kinase KdpD [Magnetococcales bacterium]